MTHKPTKNQNRKYKITSKDYELAKKLKSKMMTLDNPAQRPGIMDCVKGENNPSKRPEVRAKISAALRGRIGLTKGMKRTEESKAKIKAITQDWWNNHPNEKKKRLSNRNNKGQFNRGP